MAHPIDTLVDLVYEHCIRQAGAKDANTLERWQNDVRAQMMERFTILPLPAACDNALAEALESWREREKLVFDKMGKQFRKDSVSQTDIHEVFQRAQQVYLESGAARHGVFAGGVVKNMEWVVCFACFLPQAVPNRRIEIAKVGQCMTALFFMEKALPTSSPAFDRDEFLHSLIAHWHIAESLGANEG